MCISDVGWWYVKNIAYEVKDVLIEPEDIDESLVNQVLLYGFPFLF